jgi:hypothetical protein
MAAVPDAMNLLSAAMLSIGQPDLGRGREFIRLPYIRTLISSTSEQERPREFELF